MVSITKQRNLSFPHKLNVPWHGFLSDDVEVSNMDERSAGMFLQLTMLETTATKEGLAEASEKMHEAAMKTFLYQVLYKRLEWIGSAHAFSKPLLLFCASLCESPGDAVMWAYTLHYLHVAQAEQVEPAQHGILNMGSLTNVFPFGFPTKEARNKLWDEQKVHDLIETGKLNPDRKHDHWSDHGNWLDMEGVWPKLASEEVEKALCS